MSPNQIFPCLRQPVPEPIMNLIAETGLRVRATGPGQEMLVRESGLMIKEAELLFQEALA